MPTWEVHVRAMNGSVSASELVQATSATRAARKAVKRLHARYKTPSGHMPIRIDQWHVLFVKIEAGWQNSLENLDPVVRRPEE